MNFQPMIESLSKTIATIAAFIPLLINSLLILVVGYLISALVRWSLRFILQHIGLQQLADRVGLSHVLSRMGIRTSLPQLVARIVFFFLLLSFATAALRLMQFTTIANFLDNILLFVPRAISSALLILLGSLLARFLGNTTAAIAQNAHIFYGKALGKLVEYALVAFAIIIGISLLGVDTTILTTAFTIILAAAGFAIALTFSFGSRDAARNVIEGHYIRQRFRPGQQLTVGEYSGQLRSVSGAYTVLEERDEDGQSRTISLPNDLLIRQVVIVQEKSVAKETKTVPNQADPRFEEGT